MSERHLISALKTPAGAAVAACLPWVSYLTPVAVTEFWRDGWVSILGLIAAGLLYAIFVWLPSLFPIAAARAVWLRAAVTVVMAAVAATAGVLVASSDDAQAGLAVLLVSYVAVPLGLVLWAGRVAVDQRAATVEVGSLAQLSPRVAAVVVDVFAVGAVLCGPLTALSKSGQEVLAGVIGVMTAVLYLGLMTALRGRSLGQALMRIEVVDAETSTRVPPTRALLRSLIIVIELIAALTLVLAAPLVAEIAIASTGRSLTDRLIRTKVITT